MRKEEKITEIEEFKITDTTTLKKYLDKHKEEDKKLDKYFKNEEPFSNHVNQRMFVIGHALELIQFVDDCWYIDTRSYDLIQTNDVLTTYIYRWRFDDPLPEKLLKHIPSIMLEIAKEKHVVFIGTDRTFKMPTMGGTVVILPDLFNRRHKKEYFIINPKII